jgi:hypothetical protein
VGQVEGGHALAFSSGMAAIAAVLDLVPSGSRIVAPEDCYFGVGELLADAQQQGRWAVDRVDLTDTASVQAAVADADLLWLETPSNPLLEVADLPALCAAGRRAGAIVGVTRRRRPLPGTRPGPARSARSLAREDQDKHDLCVYGHRPIDRSSGLSLLTPGLTKCYGRFQGAIIDGGAPYA